MPARVPVEVSGRQCYGGGGTTTPSAARGPGAITTGPSSPIMVTGALMLIMASAVRLIIGDSSEIDAGVMLMTLIP